MARASDEWVGAIVNGYKVERWDTFFVPSDAATDVQAKKWNQSALPFSRLMYISNQKS
jgi:hypothetical protein